MFCKASPVTCHQRQQQQTLPLLFSPIMLTLQKNTFLSWGNSLLTQKPKNLSIPKKSSKPSKNNCFFVCKFRYMIFDQKSPVHAVLVPAQWHKQTDTTTDIATYRLKRPRGQILNSKMFQKFFVVVEGFHVQPHYERKSSPVT